MTAKRWKRRQEGNLVGYRSVLCERWQRNRLAHHEKRSVCSGCHNNAPQIGFVSKTDIYFLAVLSQKSEIGVPVWSGPNELSSCLAPGWMPFHCVLTRQRKKEISSSKDHHEGPALITQRNPNYLLTTSCLNSIILRVRASSYEFGKRRHANIQCTREKLERTVKCCKYTEGTFWWTRKRKEPNRSNKALVRATV